MESTSGPGAGAQEPPGVVGVEWSEGCPWNWRDPPRPRACGPGSVPGYNRHGKCQVVERESEGVVVVTTGRTTQPVPSEGPLLHRCTTKETRSSDECRAIG